MLGTKATLNYAAKPEKLAVQDIIERAERVILSAQTSSSAPRIIVAVALPGKSYLVAVAATALVAAAIHLAVAIGAIDWLVATRYEGHFSVLATVGAYNLRHCALGTTVAATT